MPHWWVGSQSRFCGLRLRISLCACERRRRCPGSKSRAIFARYLEGVLGIPLIDYFTLATKRPISCTTNYVLWSNAPAGPAFGIVVVDVCSVRLNGVPRQHM